MFIFIVYLITATNRLLCSFNMQNSKIKVFARIKPPRDCIRSHPYEIKANKIGNGGKKILLLHSVDEKYILNNQPKLQEVEEFLFENVFTENSTQEYIYNCMAKPVVERAIEGFNGTIMAYGQTGTGKTHTICGGRDKGIIPRAFKNVFHSMKEAKKSFKVFLSVMEIYNEHAYDLLSEQFTRDKTSQVTPRNLKTILVCNLYQLDKLLKKAWNNRIVSETQMNDASSRSHCIFSLHLHQTQNSSSSVMISKVHMIDLSGSEKLGKRRPSGMSLNETRHINLSLHYIELVIRALSDKNRDHIPYRNSMITSFLRDSLGGNSNTVMVFTLSLDPIFFYQIYSSFNTYPQLQETAITCRFAQRVSLISNKMKKQISQNQDMELVTSDNNKNFKSNGIDYVVSEEDTQIESKRSVTQASVVTGNHKGITCKLGSSSESSSSSCLCDSDGMSIFDDQDLSKYIDELLSEEDLTSLNYCYDKQEREEKNSIIELDCIQRRLNGLIEVTQAFKMFSPKSLNVKNDNDRIYECLGLGLPSSCPMTGKIYNTNEKQEFLKFLSRTLSINNFKIEYYDEYCDLLIKECQASSALNKYILLFEKSKNLLHSNHSVNNNKTKQLEIKERKIKEKQNLLEDIKNKRHSIYRKVVDLKTVLIKQYHEEWLPEKENMVINNVEYENENHSSMDVKDHKQKIRKVKDKNKMDSKKLGKSISDTNEYRAKTNIQDTTKGNICKPNNVASDTIISCISRDSKASEAINSAESEE